MALCRLVVESFPNREIRFRVVQEKPAQRFSYQCETDETHHETAPADRRNCDADHSDPPSLVISSELESGTKTVTPGFGKLPRKTRFGLNAKRTIHRIGGVFDQRCPSEETLFLTGTLPGSTGESLRAIAEWSGYLVHRLKAWINFYAPGKFDYYCWEHQKRGALHLHYVVWIPDPDVRRVISEGFHDQWCGMLEAISARTGVDMFARQEGGTWRDRWEKVRARAEVVRSSTAAYMAKYLSKSGGEFGERYCPSRWWGCSRAVSQALREMSSRFAVEFLSKVKANSLYQDLLHFASAICQKVFEYRTVIGDGINAVGYVDKEINLKELPSWLKDVVMSKNQSSSAFYQLEKEANYLCALIRSLQRTLIQIGENPSLPMAQSLLAIQSGSMTLSQLTCSDWLELKSLCSLVIRTGVRSDWVRELKQRSNFYSRMPELQSAIPDLRNDRRAESPGEGGADNNTSGVDSKSESPIVQMQLPF